MLYTETHAEETPAGTQWRSVPVPPAYAPHAVAGFGEGPDVTRAIVHVRMCLTRDELLAAVQGRWEMGPFDLDAATPDEIRTAVEYSCAAISDLDLHWKAVQFWGGYDDWDPAAQQNVAAMVRAIDRAYPVGEVSGIVVDGTPARPSAHCQHCPWTEAGGDIEVLLHRGLVHSETHRGQS